MTELEEKEMFVENDFIYISVEKKPAYKWLNQTVSRRRTAVELTSLLERNPMPGNSSSVTLKVSHISSAKLFTDELLSHNFCMLWLNSYKVDFCVIYLTIFPR